MVNTDMVNGARHIFRRRIFAILFLLLPDFYDSKIPLNISEYSVLTDESTGYGAACRYLSLYINKIDWLAALYEYSRLFCYITSNSKSFPQAPKRGRGSVVEG